MLLPYLNKELIEPVVMRLVVAAWQDLFMPLPLYFQKILRMSY